LLPFRPVCVLPQLQPGSRSKATLSSACAPRVVTSNGGGRNARRRGGGGRLDHKTGSIPTRTSSCARQRRSFDRFEADGTVFGSMAEGLPAISCVLPPRGLVVEFERRLVPVDGRSPHETETRRSPPCASIAAQADLWLRSDGPTRDHGVGPAAMTVLAGDLEWSSVALDGSVNALRRLVLNGELQMTRSGRQRARQERAR